MISVVNRKLMTSDESFLTRAPITPKEVSRRYSKGLDLEVVLRNGYKNKGMWAKKIVSKRTSRRRGDGYYRSRSDFGCHCETPHIAAKRERCTHGLKRLPLAERG